ncbi:MAG: helix-turn-helix transcriptional regulator [Treponema sp.]|nr:helix-turn-helix transcriptional regulator [Treponema sp.]
MTTFFKKASGKSLKQFILERKMEEAKALLSDSTRTVSEIAYSLGFSDNHNFSRAFKKVTGQSPSEYRDSFADRMLYNV